MADNTKGQFSVNLWESHPDEGNDDCDTGADFQTEAEASPPRACMAQPSHHAGDVPPPTSHRITPTKREAT